MISERLAGRGRVAVLVTRPANGGAVAYAPEPIPALMAAGGAIGLCAVLKLAARKARRESTRDRGDS